MSDLNIKLYADGANIVQMLDAYNGGLISGFTTNPTLMKAAGVTDYESFAKDALTKITDMPISFEVFSDELDEMERQAKKIAGWGENVYVKIPVTNTQGVSTAPIIQSLSGSGVKLNITAIFSLGQTETVIDALSKEVPSVISIFAGRIANTGVDPIPLMAEAVDMAKVLPESEVLWASPREALNVLQAQECGCHIITITSGILSAIENFGKNLEQYSIETVQMFYRDATSASYSI